MLVGGSKQLQGLIFPDSLKECICLWFGCAIQVLVWWGFFSAFIFVCVCFVVVLREFVCCDAQVVAFSYVFSHETLTCLLGHILAVTIAFSLLKEVIQLTGLGLDAIRYYREESESNVWLCAMDPHVHSM